MNPERHLLRRIKDIPVEMQPFFNMMIAVQCMNGI